MGVDVIVGVSSPPRTPYNTSFPLDGVPFVETADSVLLEECSAPIVFLGPAEALGEGAEEKEEPQPPHVEFDGELSGVDMEDFN